MGLDPFTAATGAPAAARPLDPLRVADAAPASTTPSHWLAPRAKARPAPRSARPTPTARRVDLRAERLSGVQSSTNILYLYYRDGAVPGDLRPVLVEARRDAGTRSSRRSTGTRGARRAARTSSRRSFWRFENYVSAQRRHGRCRRSFVRSSSPDSVVHLGPAAELLLARQGRASTARHPALLRGRSTRRAASLYSWFGLQQRRTAPQSDGAFLWLYWHGEDRKAQTAYNVVFPLYWDFKRQGRRSQVLFPLLWSYSGAGLERRRSSGRGSHLRRPNSTFDTALPAVVEPARRQGRHGLQDAACPLFYWQSTEHGRASLWLSPIGGYSRDDDARSRTLAAAAAAVLLAPRPGAAAPHLHAALRPRTARTRTTRRRSSTAGALLPARRSARHDARPAAALLALPRRRDRARRRRRCCRSSRAARGPRDTTTLVGVLPVWAYWRSFRERRLERRAVPAGLLRLERGPLARRRLAAVLALVERRATRRPSSRRSSTGTATRRGHAGGVPPAADLLRRARGRLVRHPVPALLALRERARASSTTALPVGYYHRDPRRLEPRRRAPCCPIFYVRSGAGAVALRAVPDLLALPRRRGAALDDRARAAVAPHVGGETTDALFPLFYYRRGARPGGADETSFRCFPLFHYRRDAETARARHAARRVGARTAPRGRLPRALPLVQGRGPRRELPSVPLRGRLARLRRASAPASTARGSSSTGRATRAARCSRSSGHYADPTESDTFVFPTFFRLRRNDGSRVDTFLPLFWRSSAPGAARRRSWASGTTTRRPAPHRACFPSGSTRAIRARPHRVPAAAVRSIARPQDRRRAVCSRSSGARATSRAAATRCSRCGGRRSRRG